jgi:hypothetical protein
MVGHSLWTATGGLASWFCKFYRSKILFCTWTELCCLRGYMLCALACFVNCPYVYIFLHVCYVWAFPVGHHSIVIKMYCTQRYLCCLFAVDGWWLLWHLESQFIFFSFILIFLFWTGESPTPSQMRDGCHKIQSYHIVPSSKEPKYRLCLTTLNLPSASE